MTVLYPIENKGFDGKPVKLKLRQGIMGMRMNIFPSLNEDVLTIKDHGQIKVKRKIYGRIPEEKIIIIQEKKIKSKDATKLMEKLIEPYRNDFISDDYTNLLTVWMADGSKIVTNSNIEMDELLEKLDFNLVNPVENLPAFEIV